MILQISADPMLHMRISVILHGKGQLARVIFGHEDYTKYPLLLTAV